MSTPFLLTRAPITLTTPQIQPLYLALDVSRFDVISVLVGVPALAGSPTPTASVQIWTGMQTQTEDGWVQYGNTLTFTSPDSWLALTIPSSGTPSGFPLRFIRWKVTALAATSPSVTLHVAGEGASYAPAAARGRSS